MVSDNRSISMITEMERVEHRFRSTWDRYPFRQMSRELGTGRHTDYVGEYARLVRPCHGGFFELIRHGNKLEYMRYCFRVTSPINGWFKTLPVDPENNKQHHYHKTRGIGRPSIL